MAMFIKNNAKPISIIKGSTEWKKIVDTPRDKRGRKVQLPPKSLEVQALYLELGKDKADGEEVLIPVDVPPFELGDPIITLDADGKTVADRSNITSHPGIKMGEIQKYKNHKAGIHVMEKYRFCDEVAEKEVPVLDKDGKPTGKKTKKWVIIKKNMEGKKYGQLRGVAETEAELEHRKQLHNKQMLQQMPATQEISPQDLLNKRPKRVVGKE